MKKLSKSIISILICAVMVLFCLPVFNAADIAYELDDIDMSVAIPDTMTVVTRDSEKSDEFFSDFKLDYDETMKDLEDANIYLQAMTSDSSLTLTVTMTETENSDEIGNYNDLSEEELDSLKEIFLQNEDYKSCSVETHNSNTYLRLTVKTKSGKKTVQSQQCNTVINGKNYIITLQAAKGEKLTSDDKDILTAVLDSATVVQTNFFTENRDLLIFSGAVLAGVLIIAVVLIILLKHFKNPRRKDKNLIHELAHEHKITETTQIPRDDFVPSQAPDAVTFMQDYAPVGENGNDKKQQQAEKVVQPTETVAAAVSKDAVASQKVPEEDAKAQQAEIVEKQQQQDEAVEERPQDNTAQAQQQQEQEVDINTVAAAMQNEQDNNTVTGENVVHAEEENFEDARDYFDDVPEEEQMYSYTDVDNAVEDYSQAKRKAQSERQERQLSENYESTPVKVLKTVGRVLLNVLQTIWLVICYIIIHCRYFCINVYRLIKRKRNLKKRRKAEEERRQRARERRKREREAELNRQRQNERRGENDLIKVRSNRQSYPRSGYSSDTRRTQPGRTPHSSKRY